MRLRCLAYGVQAPAVASGNAVTGPGRRLLPLHCPASSSHSQDPNVIRKPYVSSSQAGSSKNSDQLLTNRAHGTRDLSASPKRDMLASQFNQGHQNMERTYENAIAIIDTRRRPGRPKSTTSSSESMKSMPTTNGTPQLKGTPSIVGMSEWLKMMGHSDDHINALNVIHIAGTKGKGSTCAFTECILRSHGKRSGFPYKTGLYTSPHLIKPEERIRIDSEPLSPELLAKYFFEIYDRLPQLATEYDASKQPIDRGPRYLQLWALLALHTFIRGGVHVAILETHNGGEYDATNVVKKPLVTAVTTLGMDHIEMLGPSIENIAWHKAGIYKAGAAALSTVQDDAPGKVLQQRAAAKGEELRVVGIDPRLPEGTLALKPTVQKKNASLAAAAASAYLEKIRSSDPVKSQLTAEDIAAGIAQFNWPGRFQVVQDGDCTWFLDAAHNDMSVAIAAQWFYESSQALQEQNRNVIRILIFSHINELRDTAGLLESLATALKSSPSGVDHVIFSTYDESEERQARKKAKSPELFHETWRKVIPDTQIWDEPTIQGAIGRARNLGEDYDGVHTLVTGSQHLVGPALRVLQERGAKA